MKEILKNLSAPLTKEDVELRVGSNSAKSFTLLLYKTARTDMKRLNEVCPTWSNKHCLDENKNVCCEISIFEEKFGMWISRQDVGTESNTEKEKGSYSDSFKRAGTRWGIGLELYNTDTIRIMWNMKESEYKGKKKYTPIDFWPNNLELSKYEVADGKPKVEIKYDGKIIFPTSNKKTPQKPLKIVSQGSLENPEDPIWDKLKAARNVVGIPKYEEIKKSLKMMDKIYQCGDAYTLVTALNAEVDKDNDIPQ